ncbi:hypothetical protein HDU98_008508 [Podochytrium sp. JEL0797]|nr:hypothetical protein HDU98_008508 [Podochytrium sp. JEL0797]
MADSNVSSPFGDQDSDFHGGSMGGALRMSNMMMKNNAVAPSAPTSQIAKRENQDGKQIHGDSGGSLALSASMSSNSQSTTPAPKAVAVVPMDDAAVIHGDAIGSLKISEVLSSVGKASVDKANVAVVSPVAGQIHGNAVGALQLSEKLSGAGGGNAAPAVASPGTVQIHGESGNSMKLSQAMSGAGAGKQFSLQVSDATTIDEVLTALAKENDWDDDDVAQDASKFKKYRIKNVKQAREISGPVWDEMTELLPTTKDLVRSAIGWVKH